MLAKMIGTDFAAGTKVIQILTQEITVAANKFIFFLILFYKSIT
jgi:hypothetical protein